MISGTTRPSVTIVGGYPVVDVDITCTGVRMTILFVSEDLVFVVLLAVYHLHIHRRRVCGGNMSYCVGSHKTRGVRSLLLRLVGVKSDHARIAKINATK